MLIAVGTCSFVGLAGFFISQIQAEEYTPLDFSENYDKFEIVVGTDINNGRYLSYHYEFNE
ncbi:MAG: hypothetical protein U9R06_00380 [Patescibacteria group bacterium]|nr:hypothetical protein [Patescibacteria group bacterium]